MKASSSTWKPRGRVERQLGSPAAPVSSWQQQPGRGRARAWCMLRDYMHKLLDCLQRAALDDRRQARVSQTWRFRSSTRWEGIWAQALWNKEISFHLFSSSEPLEGSIKAMDTIKIKIPWKLQSARTIGQIGAVFRKYSISVMSQSIKISILISHFQDLVWHYLYRSQVRWRLLGVGSV